MNPAQGHEKPRAAAPTLLQRLQQRGVLRVAFSYAVIAWLTLQIGDVVLDPLDAPAWMMRALIVVVAAGFPVAILLAWFFELGPAGITRDTLPEAVERPAVTGVRRYADVMIIGVLLIAVVFLLLRQQGWLEEEAGPRVIGVLPFSELGVAEEEAYFGAGLADTLTYKLGQLQQLLVLAPSSTLEFRGQNLDLMEVGAKLGATALLQGTVRRAEGLLRVNARLVDTASGRQLWSGTYDRRATDLFAVQDEIASAVTDALHLVLSPDQEARLAKAPTLNLTAYDAYLLGHSRLATRDLDDLQEGVAYFRQAIGIDPDYALAHAGLAQALMLQKSYDFGIDWRETGPQAQRAAERAQELDPQLGEAWLARAMVAMADNEVNSKQIWSDEYLRELLETALQLSPNSAEAAQYYSRFVPDSEALKWLERAAQLDPRSGIIRLNLGESYAALGDYERAREWMLAAARATEVPFLRAYKELVDLEIYGPGQLVLAARLARAVLDVHSREWPPILGGMRAYTELGAWDEAQRLLDELADRNAREPRESLQWIVRYSGTHLALAQSDFESAGRRAQRFVDEQMTRIPTWPRLDFNNSGWLPVLDTLALADIQAGHPERALERYELAFGEDAARPQENIAAGVMRRPLLLAALHRLRGDEGTAERLLREQLVAIEGYPIIGQGGMGFTRFTIHAFLGETEAALEALESALDTGYTAQWWGLEHGNFDSNYAAVTADPRFKALHADLLARVTKMREEFRANPALPEGLSVR